MRGGSKGAIAGLALAFTSLAAAAVAEVPAARGFTATPLVVDDLDVVEADAELAAFFVELSRMVESGKGRAELFAPTIRVFVRPDDPLAQPIEARPAMRFGDLAARMREAGEPMPRVAPGGDAFLERLVSGLGGDDPLGRIGPPVDAICQPAARGVDRVALVAALAAIGGKGRDLRYSTEGAVFRLATPGRPAVDLPPNTLLMREPAAGREPRFVLTDGRKGTLAREAARGQFWRSLRTRHTCFGKVDGAWKITAVILAGRDD